MEALRARVEDPHARRDKLVVDFADLRDNLPRHISKFELFRPLLWSFFQGLLRAQEWQSAEMLLSVLVGALPAAVDRDPSRLAAACRFVASGAVELQGTGANGVANRLVIHALARLRARMLDAEASGDPADEGSAAAAERSAYIALMREVIDTFPIEKDRLLSGYAHRAFQEILLDAAGHPSRQHTACTLWTALMDRVLSRVTPGRRAPGIDHLLGRLHRLLSDPERAQMPEVRLLIDAAGALPRFKQWWASFVEQRTDSSTSAFSLPPELLAMALGALRTPAPDETPQQAERRLLALAAIGTLDDLPAYEVLLDSRSYRHRRAALRGMGLLRSRLSKDGARDPRFGEIVTRFVDALDDSDERVVRAAVAELGGSASPNAFQPLLEHYRLTPQSNRLLSADILDAIVGISAAAPREIREERVFFLSERERYLTQARGRQRDRILAALEALGRG